MLPIYKTKLESKKKEMSKNQEAHAPQIDRLKKLDEIVHELEEKARTKFKERRKILPRERIEQLIDAGSEFLELCPYAGNGLYGDKDGSMTGGGIIAGVGRVSRTDVLLIANNSAIKGGTISPSGLKKILRLHEIALQNKLPIVTMAESGGANLNFAHEVYIEGARAFANQARLSAQGIPQITIVFGNATAGGAYQPGLSDYIIMVEKGTKMFLAGPPLTKAATGEQATDEQLGGAKMHSSISGTSEYLVKTEKEALSLCKTIVENLNLSSSKKLRIYDEPRYSSQELLGIVPANAKLPFDMKEIWARVFDDSRFLEFKSEYDPFTLCAHAKIKGQLCGVIGNNGPITAKGAGKAAQFIELCEQSRIPILFFHNTTGFMVGTHAEQSGIIKQGSKMIQAVANASVPKISLLIGGSYGAGNYAMCGRGFDPHFLFSWPISRTAVMGGEQAGKVLRIVMEEKYQKTGQEIDQAKVQKLESEAKELIEKTSDAFYASAQLWDDGIILPEKTRDILSRAIEICLLNLDRKYPNNTFGVPRH